MTQNDLLKNAIEKRREREKQSRIDGILSAAQDMFLAKGYFSVTMDEIAICAGFSKPTIYKYFNSKEDLFLGIILPVITQIQNQLVNVEQKLTRHEYQSAGDLIHDFFQAAYRGYLQSPASFRIIQIFQQSGDIWKLSENMRTELNALGHANAETGRNIIRLAAEQGLICQYDEIELGDVLYAVFIGLVQIGDIKSHRGGFQLEKRKTEKGFLRRLELAEELLINALSLNPS